ncbi:MAG: SDR family oxidoreductase [Bacteroidota bacterium]
MRIVAGQVAIVTGAAHGVGLSISKMLLDRGVKVVMIDRDREALAALETDLQSEKGVSAYRCDITNEESIASARKSIAERYEAVHLLINSAGVSADSQFVDHSLEDFRWVLDTNLMGTVNMCKYFLPMLLAAGGHIVNVGSAAALFGFPGKTAYCASKFAITGFSQSLRIELHREGVGVTVAYLGPVNTEMISRSRVEDDEKKKKMQDYLHKKGMEPDQVALQILHGIEGNRSRIFISSQSKQLAWFGRWMPKTFLGLLGRFQDRLPA